MTDGLKDNHRNAIIDILSANKRIERVVLFGSRAMGTYTMTSDVDLVLYGDHLTLTDQAHLADALDKLTVPQRVDLVLHNVIDNDELCKHIERHGIEWYRRQRNMGLTDAIDITDDQRKVVYELIERHLPNTTTWVYGSRAKWTARPQSDLDMVVFATPEQNSQVFDLREAFEESNLPFRVDLFVWDDMPERFRKRIEAEHVVLVEREERSAGGETLANFVDITMGQSPPGNTVFSIGGVPLLNGPTEFGPHHPTPKQFTTSPRKYAHPGDILFCVRGSTTGRMNWANQEYAIGRGIAAIRHRQESALQPFVRAVIECELVELLAQATGSTFPNVSTSQLAEIPYPDLDIDEQRAIAHILGTLDDKIELNRRMNETLEEMARALFKSWFVDFDPVRAKMEGRDTGLPPDVADLFPDRLVESELGEIPEGWEVRPLANCFNLTMGQSPPGSTYNDDGDGLPFFQGCSDFGFRYPENRRFCTAPTRIAHSDDTLVSVRAPVGEINMAWEKCCIGRGVAALRHKSGSSSFTYYATQVLQPQLRQYEETGTVFGSINRKQFETLPVLAPKAELLDCFETYMLPLEQRIRVNVSESRTLAVLRDALLPKLVSGELRVVESMGREGLYHYS